jgi:hypothetical protein
MRSRNLDGGAEERDTALATRMELILGLTIGFSSHSHMVTKLALHFGKVVMNTLLDSGKIKVTANFGQLLICPMQGCELRCRTY